MPFQEVLNRLDSLSEAIAKAETAVVGNTEARLRAVSVMAKNLQPGDLIEWPNSGGQQVLNGKTMEPDRVGLVANNPNHWAFLEPDQRVRVYRG